MVSQGPCWKQLAPLLFLSREGRGEQKVLIPIPWELSGGLAVREEAGERAVESLRWGQLQRWLEKVPLNCQEGCRGSSPE